MEAIDLLLNMGELDPRDLALLLVLNIVLLVVILNVEPLVLTLIEDLSIFLLLKRLM